MGITGLLKGLQGVTEKRNVRDFANQSLAIDASSWLHKSVYSISREYVEALARDPTGADPKCVRAATQYVIRRCQELLTHANIGQLYLVLDGQRCPLKVVTNDSREQRRQQNLKEARHFIRRGQYKKAEEKYKTCIKINAAMATQVIEAVTQHFAATRVSGGRGRTTNTNTKRKKDRVLSTKSPYEADAQLVKLCIDGLTHAIVTEDSDVLVYLAACQVSYPILFKLDRNNGECDVISTDWLLSPSSSLLLNENNNNANRNQKTKKKKETAGGMTSILQSFSARQQRHPGMGSRLFVQACVLTGCDYAPSQLNGVGLVTAFKLIRDHAHRSCEGRFHHVLTSLKQKITLPLWEKEKEVTSKCSILQQYEELLAKSEAVFYHHPVLQVSNQKIAFLTPRPPLSSATASTLPKQVSSNQEQDNNKSLYNPNLSRFQDNLPFLGTVQDTTTIMANDVITVGSNSPPQQENDTNVPVPEIIIQQKHHTLSSTTNNSVNKAPQQNNRRKRPAKPIANPYKKQFQSKTGTWLTSKHTGKRKQQEQQDLTCTIETCLPLSNIDRNHQLSSRAEKTSKRQQQEKQPLPSSPPTNNIFSQFQYSPTDENNKPDESEKENEHPPSPSQQEQTKNDLSMYQYKKGRDVRFVKPKFSKQGGRSKPKRYFSTSVKTVTASTATTNIQRPQREEEEEERKGDEREDFLRPPQQPPIDRVDGYPPTLPPLSPSGEEVQAIDVEDNCMNGSKFFNKSSLTNTAMYPQQGAETYLSRKAEKGEIETDMDINPAKERVNSHLPQDVAAHQGDRCSYDEDASISRVGYKKSSLDNTIESQEYGNTNDIIRDIDKQLRDTLSDAYHSDPIGEGVLRSTDTHHIVNINNQYSNDEIKAHLEESVVNDPPKDDYTYFKQCDKLGAETRIVTETSSSSSSLSVSSEVAVVDSSYDENDIVRKQQEKHNRLHYILGGDDNNNIHGNDCIKGATEKPDFAVIANEDIRGFDDDPSSPMQSKYWGSSSTKQRSKARRVTRSPQKSSSPTLDAFRAIGGGNQQPSEDEIGSFGEESPQPVVAAAQPRPHVGTHCWDMSSQRSTKNKNDQYGSHLSKTVRKTLNAVGEHHKHDHNHNKKDDEEIIEAVDTDTCNATFEDFSSTNRFSQSSGSSRNSRKTPFLLSQASSLRSYHSQDSKQHQPKKSGPIHKFFRKHQYHQPCKSKSVRPSPSSSSSFFSRQNATKHRVTKKASSRHKSKNIAGYFPTLPWKSTNSRDDDSF